MARASRDSTTRRLSPRSWYAAGWPDARRADGGYQCSVRTPPSSPRQAPGRDPRQMSSTSSIPTEIRTRSAGTPAAPSASSDSCWWVVEAGWMTSVRVSPTLARWLQSSTDSTNARPASRPPRTPKAKTAPGPAWEVPLGEGVAGGARAAPHTTPKQRRDARRDTRRRPARWPRGRPSARRGSRDPAAEGRR